MGLNCVKQSDPNNTFDLREDEQKRKEYLKNREIYLERAKNYKQENIEQIKEKRCEKITCNCGKIYSRNDKARHVISLFHQQYIDTSNTSNNPIL